MEYKYRELKRFICFFVVVTFCLFFNGCPPYEIGHDYTDTNGLARGIAVQNIYAYIADGVRGLKIFNISNPESIHQVGQIDLPGFNDQIHVSGNIAVVNDSDLKKVYIINSWLIFLRCLEENV